MARFMYGRYGIDQLYYALLALYLVLLVINALVPSRVWSILMWAVLILIFFRVFSRDIYKRRMENEKFMRIWNRVKGEQALTIRRIKEIKTHRFRRCPHCKGMLRLRRKVGKHTVRCPRCHKKFKLYIFW